MSDSVQPHRRQPTTLLRPWDSPGKNTGVGCHCLLRCMKVKSASEVAQSGPTPSDPMDCSPPGPSVHGIFQARVLDPCKWAGSCEGRSAGQGGKVRGGRQGRFVSICCCCSVTMLCQHSVPPGLLHQLPCSVPSPRRCSNSCPLSYCVHMSPQVDYEDRIFWGIG